MTEILDVHTHIFNVGFLPVEGVMLARGVPHWIAAPVTKFLERELERELPGIPPRVSQGVAPDRIPLMEMLERELSAGGAAARADTTRVPDAPDLIAQVVQRVPGADLDALRPDLEAVEGLLTAGRASRAISDARLGAMIVADPHERERRLLDQLLREAAQAAPGPVITGIAPQEMSVESLSAKGLIEWLLLLLVHEARIVRAFAGAWNPAAQFIGRVHHHMDMELHYRGRAPVYQIAQQLNRIRAVAESAELPLLPFVAFEPFRPDGVAIVADALQHGFAGVKFYPPNGYRPADNADVDLDQQLLHDKGIRLSGADVDRQNLALFRECVARGTPIFTHCTSGGMEARPGITGHFSNPRHWRKALQTSGLSALRLCFGHAGGQEGWMAPLTAAGNSTWAESYAYEVLALCVEFPNVYCDFGYFDGFLASGEDANRLQQRLEAAVRTTNGQFARKCCYGTDWHLVSIQQHAAEYPSRFEQLIRSSRVLAPFVDAIMHENALAFLNRPAYRGAQRD